MDNFGEVNTDVVLKWISKIPPPNPINEKAESPETTGNSAIVPPWRIERQSKEPESFILSIKLWGHPIPKWSPHRNGLQIYRLFAYFQSFFRKSLPAALQLPVFLLTSRPLYPQ